VFCVHKTYASVITNCPICCQLQLILTAVFPLTADTRDYVQSYTVYLGWECAVCLSVCLSPNNVKQRRMSMLTTLYVSLSLIFRNGPRLASGLNTINWGHCDPGGNCFNRAFWKDRLIFFLGKNVLCVYLVVMAVLISYNNRHRL
jgi:ABC-type uncharacterized transport system YnjBCD permease subunit